MGNTLGTTTTIPEETEGITTTEPEVTRARVLTQVITTTSPETTSMATLSVQTTQPIINQCKPNNKLLSKKDCNKTQNCLYAANFCYNLEFDKLGIIDNTFIDCLTNRNNDKSYTLSFESDKKGLLFIIKKIDFIVKDLDNTTDNPYLNATYINLDITKPIDKEKVYIINENGSLVIRLKISGGSGTGNFDFTEITLTDINNKSINLKDTNKQNTIINRTSITQKRNKLIKIEYNNLYAQKTRDIDQIINDELKSIIQ
jgi:hypothetical protein